MKLISGAECVRKMRQAGVYKGKESYFSQLVTKGIIPYHQKKGSPKKWYILDEVKKAIKEWEDPTRDAQREANEKKRETQTKREELIEKLQARYDSELNRLLETDTNLNADMFVLDDYEGTIEEFKNDLIEINGQNQIIKDMAMDYLDISKIKNANDELDTITYFITCIEMLSFFNTWTMTKETLCDMDAIELKQQNKK